MTRKSKTKVEQECNKVEKNSWRKDSTFILTVEKCIHRISIEV